jgi:hypothetical protein
LATSHRSPSPVIAFWRLDFTISLAFSRLLVERHGASRSSSSGDNTSSAAARAEFRIICLDRHGQRQGLILVSSATVCYRPPLCPVLPIHFTSSVLGSANMAEHGLISRRDRVVVAAGISRKGGHGRGVRHAAGCSGLPGDARNGGRASQLRGVAGRVAVLRGPAALATGTRRVAGRRCGMNVQRNLFWDIVCQSLFPPRRTVCPRSG